MNAEDKFSFENMFQHISSSQSQLHSSSSINDQDDLVARRKLEQKRLFQQKKGQTITDVDSLMQSMFTDLKLKPKSNVPTISDLKVLPSTKSVSSNATNNLNSSSNSNLVGAADWSKIGFDDELQTIFRQSENRSELFDKKRSNVGESMKQIVYPEWCCQPIGFLPLVYQQVFEASYSKNIIQTSILYPILLLSGLRQEQLGQIWSQVNLTQPGTLVKEELFMGLALIALAQNSHGNISSIDCLYHLTEIPIPNFQIQQVKSESSFITPVIDVNSSSIVYEQENFADFTSFPAFEETKSIDDNLIEHNHLSSLSINHTSSETQSIASLDLPMTTLTINNQENSSEKEICDVVSFSSLNNNDLLFTIDTQSCHSNNSTDQVKLELTQFSFFSDESSSIDSHGSVWLRCFEKCHSILSQANEIFSSIESSNLCTEILQQSRARDYVYNLQEIFHVHKRIYTVTHRETTIRSQLTTLWKQIVVLWTNLQSFFSTVHLHLLNDDDVDYSSLLSDDQSSYCSICLLPTNCFDNVLPSSSLSSFNRSSLTFAARFYHAPCANFYLNLIDGILPALQRLS